MMVFCSRVIVHCLPFVHDSIVIFKKETNNLINYLKVNINNVHRIDAVVGKYHDQGTFRFPIKLIDAMDDKENIEREAHVGYIHCRKNTGTILKSIIIMKLGELFNKLLHSFSLMINTLLCITRKEHCSPKWYIICILHPKAYIKYEHICGERWTIIKLKLMFTSDKIGSSTLGVKGYSYWKFVPVDRHTSPILHNQINLGK